MKSIAAGLALAGYIMAAGPVWPESGASLNVTVSSLPEAQIAVNQDFIFPLLQGEGPLTAGNNLKLSLSGDVTPVSMNAGADLALTPAAFAQVIGGVKLGSGWNVPGLADGLGLMVRQDDGQGAVDGAPFDGLVWKAWAAGLIQFDLAAVVPGDWNHLAVQTRQEIHYRGYTRAGPGESWLYEADAGENLNGFVYYGMYLLGYLMPASPVLDMAALMAETRVFLYDTPGRERWGDDLPELTLSAIGNFKITRRVSSAFIVQLRTARNFTNYPKLPQDLAPGVERDALYYRDRILDTAHPLALRFFRAALIVTVKLSGRGGLN